MDNSSENISSESNSDPYNLNISVAVAETETNEVDNEFNDAIIEMEGEKSFQCEKCGNVCKSNAEKHAEIELRETVSLDKDTVDSFVVSIRTRIIEENLYGA